MIDSSTIVIMQMLLSEIETRAYGLLMCIDAYAKDVEKTDPESAEKIRAEYRRLIDSITSLGVATGGRVS